MSKLHQVLVALLVALLSTGTWADVPSEEFLVTRADLHPELLSRTVAVFSVGMPADEAVWRQWVEKGDPEQPRNAELELRHIPARHLTADGFSGIMPIPFEKTHPLSQSRFIFRWARRYPVIDQRGSFIELVIDPRSMKTVWVDHDAWADDLKTAPTYMVDFHLLSLKKDQAWTGDDQSHITLLDLEAQGLRLYRRPSRDSESVPVDTSTLVSWLDEPESLGNLDGAYVLSEIRGDLARLTLVDACSVEEDRHLGWVPIFDESGNLAIWPTTGLIC